MKNLYFILIFTFLAFSQCSSDTKNKLSTVKQPIGGAVSTPDSLDLVIKGDLESKSVKAYGYMYEVNNITVLEGNIDSTSIPQLNVGNMKYKKWKNILPDYYTSQQASGITLGFKQIDRENKWQGFQNNRGYWKLVHVSNE